MKISALHHEAYFYHPSMSREMEAEPAHLSDSCLGAIEEKVGQANVISRSVNVGAACGQVCLTRGH